MALGGGDERKKSVTAGSSAARLPVRGLVVEVVGRVGMLVGLDQAGRRHLPDLGDSRCSRRRTVRCGCTTGTSRCGCRRRVIGAPRAVAPIIGSGDRELGQREDAVGGDGAAGVHRRNGFRRRQGWSCTPTDRRPSWPPDISPTPSRRSSDSGRSTSRPAWSTGRPARPPRRAGHLGEDVGAGSGSVAQVERARGRARGSAHGDGAGPGVGAAVVDDRHQPEAAVGRVGILDGRVRPGALRNRRRKPSSPRKTGETSADDTTSAGDDALTGVPPVSRWSRQRQAVSPPTGVRPRAWQARLLDARRQHALPELSMRSCSAELPAIQLDCRPRRSRRCTWLAVSSGGSFHLRRELNPAPLPARAARQESLSPRKAAPSA